MGLVDELSLIIYPGIDGKSDHPSIIECQCGRRISNGSKANLNSKSCETVGSGFVLDQIRYPSLICRNRRTEAARNCRFCSSEGCYNAHFLQYEVVECPERILCMADEVRAVGSIRR